MANGFGVAGQNLGFLVVPTEYLVDGLALRMQTSKHFGVEHPPVVPIDKPLRASLSANFGVARSLTFHIVHSILTEEIAHEILLLS